MLPAFIPSFLEGQEINDDSESSDDNIPLAELRNRIRHKENSENEKPSNINQCNTSFHDLFETPEKVADRSNVPRKKAINYRAQLVTKDIFNKGDPKFKTQASSTKGTVRENPEWFCFLCQTSRLLDMRKCHLCQKWVHEECMGLTESDDEEYECPRCKH